MDIPSLLQRIRQGEIGLYREIILAYEADVLRVTATLLRNREATRELVQETFVRAYRHLDRFDPKRGDFGTWIRGIARHVVQDDIRQRARERTRLGFYWEYLTCQHGEGPVESERDELLQTHLQSCTEQLGGDAARILEMRYRDGLEMEEIATRLGRTLHAARKYLSRVRILLRDCVQSRLVPHESH